MTNRSLGRFAAPDAAQPTTLAARAKHRKARAAAWAHLVRNGMTMTDVAVAAGVSRERVRQVLRDHGYRDRADMRGGRVDADPRRVVAALRDPACRDLRSLARLASCAAEDAKRVVRELGLAEASRRLWRLRSRASMRGVDGYDRAAIIRGLQAFHARYGRSPGMNDALAGLLPFGRTTVLRRFGRWNRAIVAAGLQPRRVKRSSRKRESGR